MKSMQLRASDEPRWLSVDVKAAVERWLRKPRRQLGLQLVVRDAAGGGRRRNYDSLSVLDGHDCCDVAEHSRKCCDAIRVRFVNISASAAGSDSEIDD